MASGRRGHIRPTHLGSTHRLSTHSQSTKRNVPGKRGKSSAGFVPLPTSMKGFPSVTQYLHLLTLFTFYLQASDMVSFMYQTISDLNKLILKSFLANHYSVERMMNIVTPNVIFRSFGNFYELYISSRPSRIFPLTVTIRNIPPQFQRPLRYAILKHILLHLLKCPFIPPLVPLNVVGEEHDVAIRSMNRNNHCAWNPFQVSLEQKHSFHRTRDDIFVRVCGRQSLLRANLVRMLNELGQVERKAVDKSRGSGKTIPAKHKCVR